MSTDETPDKRENEAKGPAGGGEEKSARRLTFHLFGADKSGDDVVVGQGSSTTEKDISESRKGEDSTAEKAGRARKLISVDELKQLAASSDPVARFAQDLLTNFSHWQKLPVGAEKDAYARKQQVAAMGMLGRAIKELEQSDAVSSTPPADVTEPVANNYSPHTVSPTSVADKTPPAVNPNIVETKAVFLETADLRALREEDLALGKKGGPAEQFLGLLDNFRRILKPGKEQEAAVRRVKRMAISLLSGRLQELQSKKGTTGDGAVSGQLSSPSDSDRQFILELKEKARGETAQHKIPAQFYERRQTLAEWAKELDEHIGKLHELHKVLEVTDKQSQPVGLNAALNRGATKASSVNHAETEIRKALAMMSEKDIKDLQ
ncbi:MAG: hypothetical protein C0469_16555, partial [Cyanobacteria bacterium DS2.3.42]|nr:hypothetical protein [Cyanobacteria bacterium DS2.3.42]